MWNKVKEWARLMKKSIYILYFASKDARVPWTTKLFTAVIVAYAFSPIDLIPDFIPILGFIDDILIVPFGIYFALKMLPLAVIQDCTKLAEDHMMTDKPKNWIAASIIIFIWIVLIVWISNIFS